MRRVGSPLDELVDLLDLEQIEVNIFRGNSPDENRQRVFGGQVAGQALVAAGRTVPEERGVHSLHAYFLRPGDPTVPIVYEVDRIRDGRSFTTRRVVAVQHGKAIFNLSASFQISEPGIEHQGVMPAAPDPTSLPTMFERLKAAGVPDDAFWSRPRPIDVRHVETPVWLDPSSPVRARQMVWMRADGSLGDDPLKHVCVMTYASDMTLLDSVLMAHGLSWRSDRILSVASLDHAMWFHRPFRADEWLLYVQESPASGGARGLARGELWTQDGRHVVSVVQEGLLRVANAPQ
ncbi:MAG: acyl-CoA thioesterase [Frankiaceae bacterium]|nr:acyl-CoA thioesterase [Frankiaceae bacterium]